MHLVESVSLSSWMLSYLCHCSQQRRAAMLTALWKAAQNLTTDPEPGWEWRCSGDEVDRQDRKNASFLRVCVCACALCACTAAELYQFNYSQHPGIHSDTASFLCELKHPCNSFLSHYTHIIDMHTLKSSSATHMHTPPRCSCHPLFAQWPPRLHQPLPCSSSSKLFENQLSQQTSCKEWVPGTYSWSE